jgi:hypothetical protein
MLVAFEPRHLQRLAEWVEDGGRVVVAPAAASEFLIMDEELENFDTTIWEALGLDGVSIDELDQSDLPLPANPTAPAPNVGTAGVVEGMLGEYAAEDTPRAVVDVTATGSLQSLSADVRQITVPGDHLQVVASRKRRPAGELTFRDVVGARRALAAVYAVGEGEIIVVGDPMLFNNFALAQSDNSVLAAHLLLDGDRGGTNALYNVEHLLDLWQEIRARVPAARLWLMGAPSKPLRERLSGRDDVVLTGRLPPEDALAYIPNFDIALYPRTEDQGVRAGKIAEYLGAGVPTVSYDYEVVADLRETGAGILVSTPREFIAAVERLARDPVERSRVAAAALGAGRSRDWDLLADQMNEILDRYLSPA